MLVNYDFLLNVRTCERLLNCNLKIFFFDQTWRHNIDTIIDISNISMVQGRSVECLFSKYIVLPLTASL